MIYRKIVRPLLFKFEPERIHKTTLSLLDLPGVTSALKILCTVKNPQLSKTLFGLTFNNPLGLAAGFDKNGAHIDAIASMGFGFVEIGTVTPVGQAGNPQPRLFRLPQDKGILNRMGFNNAGAQSVVENLKKRCSSIIVGGNIGKNKITPNNKAADDYLKGFKQLAPYVDYFVVNVSSPNTPNLRDLQESDALSRIIDVLQTENARLAHPKPLLVKIAPDLSDNQIGAIVDLAMGKALDGLVATNTTISRSGLRTDSAIMDNLGAGGISGAPLRKRSTDVIRLIKSLSPLPVIGVGGIMSGDDALEKLKAGADLIQIYSGLIYNGPLFVKRLLRFLNTHG